MYNESEQSIIGASIHYYTNMDSKNTFLNLLSLHNIHEVVNTNKINFEKCYDNFVGTHYNTVAF
jgi:hypothetical protein